MWLHHGFESLMTPQIPIIYRSLPRLVGTGSKPWFACTDHKIHEVHGRRAEDFQGWTERTHDSMLGGTCRKGSTE